MTKKELAESVSNQTDIGLKETSAVIDAFISAIKANVTVGKSVYIRGFGTFKMKTKAARKARDIKANKIVDIPERKLPTFKISKNFTR